MVQDQREKDSGSTDRPFLSIIIPALNEEKRLPGSLAKIDAFLQTQPFTAEVIIHMCVCLPGSPAAQGALSDEGCLRRGANFAFCVMPIFPCPLRRC